MNERTIAVWELVFPNGIPKDKYAVAAGIAMLAAQALAPKPSMPKKAVQSDPSPALTKAGDVMDTAELAARVSWRRSSVHAWFKRHGIRPAVWGTTRRPSTWHMADALKLINHAGKSKRGEV